MSTLPPSSPFPWLPRLRSVIIAVVSAACGLAGSLATGLPDGELQRGSAAIADRCEAAGFRAYPPGYEPQPPAGGIFVPVPVPSPAPRLEQPAPSSPPEARMLAPSEAVPPHIAVGEIAPPRYVLLPELLWPPSPAWRGEARGWVA